MHFQGKKKDSELQFLHSFMIKVDWEKFFIPNPIFSWAETDDKQTVNDPRWPELFHVKTGAKNKTLKLWFNNKSIDELDVDLFHEKKTPNELLDWILEVYFQRC